MPTPWIVEAIDVLEDGHLGFTAATIRRMSGGQIGIPLAIRMATGAGKQLAAQHSHSLEG